MYESIDLIDVGDATSVILGLAAFGSDPDGSAFPIRQEFEEDCMLAMD